MNFVLIHDWFEPKCLVSICLKKIPLLFRTSRGDKREEEEEEEEKEEEEEEEEESSGSVSKEGSRRRERGKR